MEEDKNIKIKETDVEKKKEEIMVYAFIPYYVMRHPKKIFYLLFIIFFLSTILFWTAVWFSYIIVIIRNMSGFNMAMSWLLTFGFSLANCYIVSGPILTAIKVKLIMGYGYYRRRRCELSFRYIMFYLFVTDLDLALYKELKECIKNHREEKEKDKDDNERKDEEDDNENNNFNKFSQPYVKTMNSKNRNKIEAYNTPNKKLKDNEVLEEREDHKYNQNKLYTFKNKNNIEEAVHLTLNNNNEVNNDKKIN